MEAEISRHYKHKKSGRCCIVLALARAEATLERVVVYREVDAGTWNIIADEAHTWTRPVAEFCDGRFERI